MKVYPVIYFKHAALECNDSADSVAIVAVSVPFSHCADGRIIDYKYLLFKSQLFMLVVVTPLTVQIVLFCAGNSIVTFIERKQSTIAWK